MQKSQYIVWCCVFKKCYVIHIVNCWYIVYIIKFKFQNHKILPALIPGWLHGMNHYFTLNNNNGSQVFLPIDSVLKVESDPPASSGGHTHPYNTRSKDKHDVHNVDPEDTFHLIQHFSKKEGQSEAQFYSEQLEHQGNLELKRKQEEAARRQESQQRPPGKDFDVHNIDVNEQMRLYQEAQRASKQAGEGQKHQAKSNMDAHNGTISSSQQYGAGPGHPAGNHQDSSVDATSYGHNVGQHQFHGSQVPQQQNPQLVYRHDQGSNVGHGYNTGQQQFHNPQAPHHHQGQQPGYHQDVSHHQSQSNAQLPYPQPDPAAQMAHIPRAGGAGPHYNSATGMPCNYNGNTGHVPHRQVHQYEQVPGPVDQPDPYSQQRPPNPNPHNLEKGSMILHGEPPQPGIVKWIGYLPEANVLLAGIEMVSTYESCVVYTYGVVYVFDYMCGQFKICM